MNVEDMAPERQIERLIEQRNALWRLIEKFSMAHGDEKEDGLRAGDKDYDLDQSNDASVTVRFAGIGRLRALRLAAGSLWDQCKEIVGNTYVDEGINPRTGELIDDSRKNLYTQVAEKMGTW